MGLFAVLGQRSTLFIWYFQLPLFSLVFWLKQFCHHILSCLFGKGLFLCLFCWLCLFETSCVYFVDFVCLKYQEDTVYSGLFSWKYLSDFVFLSLVSQVFSLNSLLALLCLGYLFQMITWLWCHVALWHCDNGD